MSMQNIPSTDMQPGNISTPWPKGEVVQVIHLSSYYLSCCRYLKVCQWTSITLLRAIGLKSFPYSVMLETLGVAKVYDDMA